MGWVVKVSGAIEVMRMWKALKMNMALCRVRKVMLANSVVQEIAKVWWFGWSPRAVAAARKVAATGRPSLAAPSSPPEHGPVVTGEKKGENEFQSTREESAGSEHRHTKYKQPYTPAP